MIQPSTLAMPIIITIIRDRGILACCDGRHSALYESENIRNYEKVLTFFVCLTDQGRLQVEHTHHQYNTIMKPQTELVNIHHIYIDM